MKTGFLLLAARTARLLPERVRLGLYRLGPISRGLRAALNRAAPHGVRAVRVAAGDLEGLWLLLDLQVDKDLWLGNYEPEVAAAIREHVRAESVVYDVGANVGYTTLLLARAAGPVGRVFAFEPLPSNVDRLLQAVALNRLESRIEVIAAAVGDRDGWAGFERHASGAMGRLAEERDSFEGAAPPMLVESIRLDSAVYERGVPAPTLVKIDVEGGEAAVLRGMTRLLRETGPMLLIEVHGREAAAATLAELERAGYGAWLMHPGEPAPATIETAASTKHLVARPSEGHP